MCREDEGTSALRLSWEGNISINRMRLMLVVCSINESWAAILCSSAWDDQIKRNGCRRNFVFVNLAYRIKDFPKIKNSFRVTSNNLINLILFRRIYGMVSNLLYWKNLQVEKLFFHKPFHANFQLYPHLKNFNRLPSHKKNLALYLSEDTIHERCFIRIGVGQCWWFPCKSPKIYKNCFLTDLITASTQPSFESQRTNIIVFGSWQILDFDK